MGWSCHPSYWINWPGCYGSQLQTTTGGKPCWACEAISRCPFVIKTHSAKWSESQVTRPKFSRIAAFVGAVTNCEQRQRAAKIGRDKHSPSFENPCESSSSGLTVCDDALMPIPPRAFIRWPLVSGEMNWDRTAPWKFLIIWYGLPQ